MATASCACNRHHKWHTQTAWANYAKVELCTVHCPLIFFITIQKKNQHVLPPVEYEFTLRRLKKRTCSELSVLNT